MICLCLIYCITQALDVEDSFPDIMLSSGIPMFFVFIAIELFFAYGVFGNMEGHKTKCVFRFNDIVVSTLLGGFQQVATLLFELLGLLFDIGAYVYVYDHFRITEIHPKAHPWMCYVCIMLGRDFGYYLYHRFLHEVCEKRRGYEAHNCIASYGHVHHSSCSYYVFTFDSTIVSTTLAGRDTACTTVEKITTWLQVFGK